MRAGDLRELVTIQRATATTNSYGEPITSWSTLATVWCSVRMLSGREALNAGANQVQAAANVDVRIYYRSDVTAKMRALLVSRVLDIETVDDPDGRRRELRLMCREVLA